MAERSTASKQELAKLADTLRETAAYLDDYIEVRAGQLAARRIAEAELVANARIAAIEEAWATDKQRYADLERELRRQFKAIQAQGVPRPRTPFEPDQEHESR